LSLGESFPEGLQAALNGAEWAWTALYRDLAPLVAWVPTILARAARGDVEQEALGSLATERVGRLIDRLTEDQRAVLMLRIITGLTVEEVARVVGKKPNSVKALQRRGLATIRKEIAKAVSTL
jgi:RNA polymerase sigma factor (sigma-70 family)